MLSDLNIPSIWRFASMLLLWLFLCREKCANNYIKASLEIRINPFPHNKILDLTKLKAFADDKWNVTKIVISVFEIVENIVGKGEIACTSNFSFSHNVFKRLLSQMRQKVSLCGNGLILISSSLRPSPTQKMGLNPPPKKGFGKHCGKRRKCWCLAVSPFPTVFSTLSKGEIINLICRMQMLSIWSLSNFCISVKG